jgi:hypothetical protein
MELTKRIIRWISIAGISLMLLITFVTMVSPVEFKDLQGYYEFQKVRFYVLPSLTLVLLLSTISIKDTSALIHGKVMRAILITACVLFVMVITLFGGMCQWTDNATIFIHRHDERKTVIVRALGCGAWDSSAPVYRTVVVSDLGPWFNVVTAVDTTSLDRSEWVKVDGLQ